MGEATSVEKPMNEFDLERFVVAQSGGEYERALAEVRQARKRSHWMWYIFPQIAGLGYSAATRRYAISGLTEASAYLRHPILGPRLSEISGALLHLETPSAQVIFGAVDAQKLRSSMTLFYQAAIACGTTDDAALFARVIESFFDGQFDELTLLRIAAR